MENWDRVKELSETSETSEGTADEKYESYLDSIEAKTERLNNAWMEFSNNMANSWLVKSGLNIATFFVENLGTVLKILSTLAAFKFSGKIGSFLKNSFTQAVGWGGKKLKQISSPWRSVDRDEKGSPLLGSKLNINEAPGKQSAVTRAINSMSDKILDWVTKHTSKTEKLGSKITNLLQKIEHNTSKDASNTVNSGVKTVANKDTSNVVSTGIGTTVVPGKFVKKKGAVKWSARYSRGRINGNTTDIKTGTPITEGGTGAVVPAAGEVVQPTGESIKNARRKLPTRAISFGAKQSARLEKERLARIKNFEEVEIPKLKSELHDPNFINTINPDIERVRQDIKQTVPIVDEKVFAASKVKGGTIANIPKRMFKLSNGGIDYGVDYNLGVMQHQVDELKMGSEMGRHARSDNRFLLSGVHGSDAEFARAIRLSGGEAVDASLFAKRNKKVPIKMQQQAQYKLDDLATGKKILNRYAEFYGGEVDTVPKRDMVIRRGSIKIGNFSDQKEAFAGRGILGSRYVSDRGRMIIHKRFGKNRGYLYADADGKAIQGMTASSPEIATQKALERQSLRRIGGQMAAGAAMGAMQAAMTTKTVGSGTAGKIGKNLFGMKGNEQEIEETAGDKAGRIAAAGVGGALGSFFGPIGSMIGSTLGEGVSSIVSTLIHRSELEMKQRVADAKENLKRLDGLKSAIENNSSVMTEKLSSFEDFEKLYKYTDELSDKLLDLQSEGNVDVIAAINKTYSTFKGVQNISTIADLCEEINNGNTEQRTLIQKQLALAESQINLEQLKASQEEERYNATEKVRTFVNAAGVDNSLPLEERIEKAKEYYEETFKGLDEGRKIVALLNTEYVKLTKLDKEVLSAETNVGMLSADIYDLTTVELKDLALEGVVGRVVEALEAQNVEVRNAAGYIKDEYRTSIEQAIKSNSKFGALVQADSKTIGELRNAQENFAKSIGLATYNQQQFNDEWNKWYDKALRGELDEKMQKLVYAANPERIKQFNLAWNATNAEMEELVKKFPDLNTAIGSMKPKELREYYSVFTTFFEDIAADSSLTAENLEKLIQEYPQLLKYYSDANPDTFRLEMLRAVNEEQMIGYANALTNQMLSAGGITSEFIDSLKEKVTNPDEYDKIIKEIGSASTFNEIIDKVNELGQASDDTSKKLGNTIEKLMTEFLDYEQQVEWVNPLYEKAKQAEIDYFTEQINNLTEQKEALGNVNDERKKEIELIKAKDALENAKKQKKRVYRAGIGWTYAADEEAISSAKEQLDNLDVQKRQQDIQYQIDLLNAQKEILEQLDTEKQKEANLQALKDYFGTVPKGGLSAGFDQIVEGFKRNVIKINVATGEITDIDGNVIGETPGLGSSGNNGGVASGALGAGKEQIEDIKKQLASKEIQDIVGSTFSSQHTEGSAEWAKDAETFNKNKEKVSNLVKQADTAGVTNDANLEAARNWVRDTKDRDSAEFAVTPILSGPPEDLVDGDNVAGKQRSLYLKPTSNMEISDKIWYDQFSDPSIRSSLAVKKYLGNGTWEDWKNVDSTQELLNFPDYSILMNADHYDYWGYVKGGKKYWPYNNNKEKTPGNKKWSGDWATGTYSTPSGVSLINELGTEAIITPSGTVTALPAKTGIVPADITKNLWSLGEVAPTLVAQLGSLNQRPVNGAGGSTTYEEGQYFDNFTMNVYPAKGDDFSKILEQARAQMRLTRHNN